MLTPSELAGLKEILNDLQTEDLFSILDTVTRRMIVVQDRDEAIEALLSFTETPTSLLRRQKITKKIIFNYLRNNRVQFSATISKAESAQTCLKFWNSDFALKEESYDDSDNNPELSANSHTAQETTNPNGTIIKTMGVEFSKWFFAGLNQLQEFGPQHFWPDCKMCAELKSANSTKQSRFLHGSDNVAMFLSCLISNDKFYFDPHSEAAESEQEEHGLVRICISGVLHQMTNCVGLFDFVFGLIRNPMQDSNWKIKYVQLRINVSGDVSQRMTHGVSEMLALTNVM